MLLAQLSTLGCYKIDYVTDTTAIGAASVDHWNHRVLWGNVELDGPVQTQDLCTGGSSARCTPRLTSSLG